MPHVYVADLPATLVRAPATRLDMLLVDWGLQPIDLGIQSLAERLCTAAAGFIVI
jgi:hypothetical protein